MNKKIICHDINGKEVEVSENKVKFRPSVYGILIEENRVLLSKQWDGYDFPGGGVNIDERLDEALVREFFEETGLRVEATNVLHCETSFFHPNYSNKHKNEFWNCPLIFYKVKKIGGNLSKDNLDEGEDEYVDLPEWINLSDIKKLKFFNSVDSISIINKAIKMFE